MRQDIVSFLFIFAMATQASAQDHSGHIMPSMPADDMTMEHESMEHESMEHESMEHESMEHASVEHASVDSVSDRRDPHEYSGGYERNKGPYALAEAGHSGMADEAIFFGLWTDRFENRMGHIEDVQEYSGYAWLGNSYHRLMLKSELEWRQASLEESKTELVYSRAFSPFWDVQFAARYDYGDNAHRQWLGIGLKGMAPYWLEVDATLYAGAEGHSAASIEVEYDLLLTQRLILQPKVGMDFYGDSDIEAGHSKGLSKSKMGIRLRYEITRQFAPYVGYERVHHHGEAAEVFRPFDQHNEDLWMAGIRFWF